MTGAKGDPTDTRSARNRFLREEVSLQRGNTSPDESSACAFCRIARKELESPVVFEDDLSLSFLDHRPLFPGHCLLIPKFHCETLLDLSPDCVAPFFANVQLLSRAVEEAVEAEGSFVAINNRVSQSVAHFHVHVVPRRKGDGLKGFFWPRQPYKSEDEILKVQNDIRSAIKEMNAG